MPETKKHLAILLTLTFALKLCSGVYFSYLAGCEFPAVKAGALAIAAGDTFSYLSGMDNLLESGEYFFWNGERKVYAGRMPFYGALYLLLRTVFSPAAANDAYVLIQTLVDALATVVFAQLCFEVCRRRRAFWLGWAFYCGSFNFSFLSFGLWTESLSFSFLIFTLFFYQHFWQKEGLPNASAAGIFLAFLIVLKPYFVIIYPLFLFGIWNKSRRESKAVGSKIKRFAVLSAAFSLPLIVLLSPWIVRNAALLGRFVPAQENIWAGYNYSKAHLAFAEFAGAWGGGSIFWDANDAGCYFLIEGRENCRYELSEYALTGGYSRAEIERVRENFFRLQENYSPELDASTAAEFARLTEIYRREQPFRYHVGSKFIFLKKLFWHTNNYNLPIHPSFKCFARHQLIFKTVQFAVYFLCLTGGLIGLVKLTVQRKISSVYALSGLLLVVFFIEMRTSEVRYVSQIIPILMIGLAGLLCDWKKSAKTDNLREISPRAA